MQKHKPKFVLSKNKVIEQYTILKEMVDFVFYSSKTNPEVTSVLEENTDSEFLVHTKEGLKRVKDKAKVLFLAQGWDIEGIQELLSLGITRFIVDNESDLDSLLAYLKNHESKTIDLFLRTKLKENTLKTERYFVFGMSCDIVNRRIKELKDHPCINSLGIHFFRKTQNIAEWNLIYEIGNMFDEETLRIIGFMDIGGGFPCEYANTNTDAFKSIYKKIKELKIWLNEKSIKLIIEPGRFICAPAVKLVTYIQTMYENNIIVNASVYHGDTDAFTVPTRLLVEGELKKENITDQNKIKPYIIKGCTPCSMDIFRYRIYLENPKIGDRITFLNAGAYNFACDFCDLVKLETEIIE